MPNYLITDNATGRKFKVSGDSPPTDTELAQIFADMGAGSLTNNPADYPQGKTANEAERMRREFVQQEKGNASLLERLPVQLQDMLPTRQQIGHIARPLLEGGGAILGGGLAGTAGGLSTFGAGSVPAAVAGAALGYAGGGAVADMIEGTNPQTATEAITRPLERAATGATLELGGRAIVPAISAVANAPFVKPAIQGVANATKAGFAKLAGTGRPVVDEALKGSKSFTDAMRGKIDAEEIVNNAKSALEEVKNARATAYQGELAKVQANSQPIDMMPIKDKLQSLMAQYNVKQDPITGTLNTSRIAMGKKGSGDIEEIIQKIQSWGSQQGDETAVGLDTLKRQLDDFYSDSSQARQFVQSLKKTVHDTISAAVPEYSTMTKGYSDATKLIKDVETDFAMRKQGMSGRITADKTLRRLLSTMRDNFEMRGDLLKVLGNEGGQDLTAQVAGYTSNQWMPRGLAGTGAGLPQTAALYLINPKLAPLVAMASPRIQGEFLRTIGKAAQAAQAAAPLAKPAVVAAGTMANQPDNDPLGIRNAQ